MLKQVTINGKEYEVLDWRYPAPPDEFYSFSGECVEEATIEMMVPRLIVRPIEPIPQGVFWLDGPLQIEGIRTTKSFINAVGKCLHRDDFDYDKWLPHAAEFPAYIPPQMVPLGLEDQIDWVRHKNCYDRMRVICASSFGVTCIDSLARITSSWKDLQENFEFSNDHGKSWSECSKPAP